MPNAKDIKADISEMSLLLIGEAGAGKTEFLRHLPKPYLFDLDKGVATLAGADVDYDMFKDAPVGGKAMPKEGIYEYGTAWSKIIDKLNLIGGMIDKGTCPYESISIDSCTALAELCMNNILKNDGKTGKNPEIQHWGSFVRAMRAFFEQVTSWPLIKVATAHVERTENPLNKNIELLPMMYTKFQGMLPTFFDEVYFLDVKNEGTGDKKTRKFYIVSEKDQLYKVARTRHSVPTGILTDWREIAKAVQKARA